MAQFWIFFSFLTFLFGACVTWWGMNNELDNVKAELFHAYGEADELREILYRNGDVIRRHLPELGDCA